MIGLLEDLHREGRTIVLITHEPDIGAHAQRIVQLRDGRVWMPDGDGAGAIPVEVTR